MGLSAGTQGWLRSATPEQLRTKLAEYEALDKRRHSDREAETIGCLVAAIRRKLTTRG